MDNDYDKKAFRKVLFKIGGCFLAWAILLFIFNFIAGNNYWLTNDDGATRIAYVFLGLISNVLIIGGEYIS